jgi:hypothetical protein
VNNIILYLTFINRKNDEDLKLFQDGKMGKVTFEDLTRMYKGKMLMFDKDAPRLEDSTGRLKTVKQLFLEEPIDKNPSEDMDSHITW